jgi:hypothetical protein
VYGRDRASPLIDALHRFKYERDVTLAPILGAYLSDRCPLPVDHDVIVPVPLDLTRLRWRGFNQAAMLAAALARRTGRPIAPRALTRCRMTAPQVGLGEEERRRNVADAFAVRDCRTIEDTRVLLAARRDDHRHDRQRVRQDAAARRRHCRRRGGVGAGGRHLMGDRSGWEAHYGDRRDTGIRPPSQFLLSHLDELPPGRAVDLASGDGRHAVCLARRGWQVTAIDYAGASLERLSLIARREQLAIAAVQADLTEMPLPPAHFDVAVNIPYLERSLLMGSVDPAARRRRGLRDLHQRPAAARPSEESRVHAERGELPRASQISTSSPAKKVGSRPRAVPPISRIAARRP